MYTEKAPVQAENISATDTLLLYERGGCFGRCPIFNLVVLQDKRTVNFEGIRFVEHIGVFSTEVPIDLVNKWINQLNSMNFMEMADSYPVNPQFVVSDLPSSTISLFHEGGIKKVINNYEAPEALSLLDKEIMDWALEHKWSNASE